MDKLTKARARLILKHPFWGALLLHLEPVEAPGLGTCGTDGHTLYYDQEQLDKWTDDEVMGVIAHEGAHCAFQHISRLQHRERDKWNAATDMAANEILVADGLTLPANGLFPPNDLKGKSAEEIYAKLKDGKKSKPLDDHSKWSVSGDKEDKGLEREWREHVAQAAQLAKAQGKLPGSIDSLIGEVLRPRLDWRDLLRDYIQSAAKTDYKLSPPNKRYLHLPLYLPSIQGETVELAVAIDSSGSVSDKLLTEFMGEIKGIAEQFSSFRVHLVVCDAEVQEYRVVEEEWDWPKKIKGRGGTDFRPVFEELRQKGVEPSILVYFTDLYGEFPRDEPSYPVLWATSTKDYKVPFGDVIFVEEQGD